MGEVYRARDTRLGREVAIKVLPAGLSSDPERLKRFEREARSASALNHPNIVTIYDIGSADSVSYIAMELVQGEPLRAVMAEGALPVRRLLQIGAQVAEGLAKAHAVGIVHRDLKPENVMVTEDGLVKILDFGLAKLTQPKGSGAEKTQAPTVSGATQEGIILGTVGYMSPEQATGGAIDFRSDQFSFGSILYEMTTGRRPFQRGSAPQTLAAIIQDEPELIAALSPKTPAPLRWIVERCLSKEARKRFASTEDLASDLATIRDHLSEATSAVGLPQEMPSPRRRRWWIPAVIAATLLMALAVAGWRLRQRDYFWKNPLAGARFTRLTDWEGPELNAAISRDGKFVVFLSDRDGQFDAWVTQVGSGEFLNLTKGRVTELFHEQVGTVGFSEDGARVWLHSNPQDRDGAILPRGIWLVPTMGGALSPFLTGKAMQASWSPDGSRLLYFNADAGDPILIADRNGGNPRQIFGDKLGIHCHFPTWSPDGEFVYFVRGVPTIKDLDIWRVSSAGGVPERITNQQSLIAYPTPLDSRTLLYVGAGDDGFGLWSVDVERRIPHRVSFGLEEYLSVSGSADGRRLAATVAALSRNLWTVPISERIVDESSVSRFAIPAVRAAAPRYGVGSLFYLSSSGASNGLWRFKDGVAAEIWRPDRGAVLSAPAISSDGRRICFPVRVGERSHLYVAESDGTGARLLAQSLEVRDTPSWSPDGKWIVAVSSEERAGQLLKIPVDGGQSVRIAQGVLSNPVWSPDGRLIVYTENVAGARFPVRAVTSSGQPVPLPPLTVRPEGDRYRFLPDGKGLVLMQGGFRRQNFWLFDFGTEHLRQLTKLREGYAMKSFDVSPDGKQILFDRYRENSDVVLIDLPPR